MANAQRTFAQIPIQCPMYRTILNTNWLYPESDIQQALATTTYPYTTDGTNIICPTIDDFIGLYLDIFNQTAISQPVGNVGYSVGVGTLLQDMGKTKQFKLPSGEIIVKWNLVKQLTPQTNPPVPVPGNSPNDTIGYVVVFTSYGLAVDLNTYLDNTFVVRV